MYVGHGFEGMAFRVDRELTGGVLPDVPHRTTEEVCQMPDCASVYRNDNYIHIEPPGRTRARKAVADNSYLHRQLDRHFGASDSTREWRVAQICAVIEHGRGTAYLADRRSQRRSRCRSHCPMRRSASSPKERKKTARAPDLTCDHWRHGPPDYRPEGASSAMSPTASSVFRLYRTGRFETAAELADAD